ncbi:hypothetical protein ABW19_dt0206827 [Dactylella cylindrospora]|nr:hypothetical protein ABW19_dt0206827 [Dactylella cylindrospora]
MDSGVVSLVASLQVATLWDSEKYGWYVEGFDRSKFVEMMEKRVKVFGPD